MTVKEILIRLIAEHEASLKAQGRESEIIPRSKQTKL